MKKVEVVGVGVRLIAIAVFILALGKIVVLIAHFLGEDNTMEAIFSGIIFMSILLLSVILWIISYLNSKENYS